MSSTATDITLADLLERFGPMSAARIRYNPPPGTATEKDVIELEAQLQNEAGRSKDFQEGVQAFLEKRPAEFKGH